MARPTSTAGGTWILPRLVGQARALGLAMTGEPLGADQAEAWGLIWLCVDDDALESRQDFSRSGLQPERRVAWSPPSMRSGGRGSGRSMTRSMSNVI